MTTTQTPKENRVFPVITADEGISESLPDAVNSCLGQYFNNLGGMTPAPGLHGKIIEQVEKVEPVVETVEETAALGKGLKDQEQKIILQALQSCAGKRKDVAELLGISPRTLRYKLARMKEQGVALPA